MALTPWAIRWSAEDPCDLIRRNFRCVMCGALLMNGGSVHEVLLYAPYPADLPVHVGGERLQPESCNAREERCAAIYESGCHVWSRFWPC
jgi:hypothetical protein